MSHVISNPVPADASTVDDLRAAAARCRNCPLWRHGTQTVFGEGNHHAKLVIVGEQPGDRRISPDIRSSDRRATYWIAYSSNAVWRATRYT